MDKNVYREEEMKDLKRNKDSQSNKLLGFFFELNNWIFLIWTLKTKENKPIEILDVDIDKSTSEEDEVFDRKSANSRTRNSEKSKYIKIFLIKFHLILILNK